MARLRSRATPKIRLRSFVLVMVTSCTLIAGLVAAFLSFNSLYQNKVEYSSTIQLLELDQMARDLVENLDKSTRVTDRGGKIAFGSAPLVLARLDRDEKRLVAIKGTLDRPLPITDNQIKVMTGGHSKITMINLEGLIYVTRRASKREAELSYGKALEGEGYLFVWPFKSNLWQPLLSIGESNRLVYGVTTLGQLAFRSHPSVNEKKLDARPIVKTFLADPFTKGQAEFRGDDGKAWSGYFAKVPSANLVIFQEIPKATAFMGMIGELTWFGLVLGGIVLAVLALLYVALGKFVMPLKKMTDLLVRHKGERLALADLPSSYGEIALLSRAIDQYTSHLSKGQETKSIFAKQIERWMLGPTPMKLILPPDPLPSASKVQSSFEILGSQDTERYLYQYRVFPDRGETWFLVTELSFSGPAAFMLQTGLKTYFEVFANGNADSVENFFDGLPQVLKPWEGCDPRLKILVGRYRTTCDADDGNRYETLQETVAVSATNDEPDEESTDGHDPKTETCLSHGDTNATERKETKLENSTLEYCSAGFPGLLACADSSSPISLASEGGTKYYQPGNDSPPGLVQRVIKKNTTLVLFDHTLFLDQDKNKDRIVKGIRRLLKDYRADMVGEYSTLIRGFLSETLTDEAAERAHLLVALKLKP